MKRGETKEHFCKNMQKCSYFVLLFLWKYYVLKGIIVLNLNVFLLLTRIKKGFMFIFIYLVSPHPIVWKQSNRQTMFKTFLLPIFAIRFVLKHISFKETSWKIYQLQLKPSVINIWFCLDKELQTLKSLILLFII